MCRGLMSYARSLAVCGCFGRHRGQIAAPLQVTAKRWVPDVRHRGASRYLPFHLDKLAPTRYLESLLLPRCAPWARAGARATPDATPQVQRLAAMTPNSYSPGQIAPSGDAPHAP